MSSEEKQLAMGQAARTHSDPQCDPATRTELGMAGSMAPAAGRGTQPWLRSVFSWPVANFFAA